MTEITFGGDGGGGSKGGGDIPDVNKILDQLDEALDRVENNPRLQKVLGVGPGAEQSSMAPQDPHEATEHLENRQSVSDGPDVTVEWLDNVLGRMVAAGYGDYTLAQLHGYVENNPDEVEEMIEDGL